ncbi:NAD-dependent epimerase/dehydratase family protein [Methyloceanibacter sp. wino2]|uniref:NAD-dependent epimerase/dehydratase family protein n=1 Tax=Methyloceanibacter sp. wino2 TaxID=2170729 RepID=UPI000D3E4FD1|nr:GDP-mannose 4,6-dehydratase [Methyloceanibacter sp. wino2]
MRVIVTGADGFVGPYVLSALTQRFGDAMELVPTSRVSMPDLGGQSVVALDITDAHAVHALISEVAPTHVVHLAGIAAPTEAARNPDAAWDVNLHGTLTIARALMTLAPEASLIFAGSGLAYGLSGKSGEPLDETAILAPGDEYGATKAAADIALGAFATRGLKVIRCRPFNHAGPGQSESFVIPGFAIQIARIEAGRSAPVIRVGNLDAERDFLDVRDVARAYASAVDHAAAIAPGTILNIASGEPRRIGDILDALLALSQKQITVEQDPNRLRPSDVSRITGNAASARALLSWTPEVPFDVTLADVLDDCRARVSGS